MLSIMIDENASQQNDNVASTLDAVAAAVKHLTRLVLTQDFGTNFSGILEKLVPEERGFDSARGRIENGDGLGAPLVYAYFTDIQKRSISQTNVERALKALKDAGEWDRIRLAVLTETNEVREAAERQARAAEAEAERLRDV